MALSNLFGWARKMGGCRLGSGSACGALGQARRKNPRPAACGDKPEESPRPFGHGAGDKPREKPAACGPPACGAWGQITLFFPGRVPAGFLKYNRPRPEHRNSPMERRDQDERIFCLSMAHNGRMRPAVQALLHFLGKQLQAPGCHDLGANSGNLYNCMDFCEVYGRLPYFYITGGDPILHPDFWRLLALLKEHDIPFAILGNPFHLTDEVCMRLKGYGCRSTSFLWTA